MRFSEHMQTPYRETIVPEMGSCHAFKLHVVWLIVLQSWVFPILFHYQVHQWLEKVFSGEEVPEYEINSQTVDHLHRMAQDSEAREREAEIMIEDYEQKAEEYAAESEYTRVIRISDCRATGLVQ